MCGICGKYSPDGVRQGEIADMLRAIAHRGPDDEGIYINGPMGLGNRRLSIIDLSGGHQPMSNEDETLWIVYNGEIYNYKHLRRDLEKKGHRFKTDSDTEVIVHLYEDMAERCVDRLRGMFAFAIWDETKKKIVLARDRLGQKPLFYVAENGNFLFASEIKAILAAGVQARELDYESLHHYLSLRFIPAPQTMIKSIKKLAPANVLVWQDEKINITRYWDPSFCRKFSSTESDLIDGLEEKLIASIKSHLISDVPIGAFLSGGMDSSMIVAIMARIVKDPLSTFTIGVKEQSFNELPYAKKVADRYHTHHTEHIVESEIIRLLPKIIWHLDEPSDPIAACQFHAAELAAPHVKVVLGGDGGDELFAGFDRYLGVGYVEPYSRVPGVIRDWVIGPILDRISEDFEYKNLTQKLRWIHQLSRLPNVAERFAEATCFFRFNHQEKQALFGDELWRQVGDSNSADVIVSQFNNNDAHDVIDKMLYADFMTRLPEHSLMLTDRMTMAHGLEARSPYLDHELVEFLAAFPSRLKIRGRKLKYVLRKIASEYLPEEIIRRRKQGFMFPVAFWFRNELYDFVRSFLLDSFYVKQGLFNKERVLRLLEDHRQNRVDNHVRLWMLLNLEIWHRIYIQQIGLSTVGENLERHLHP
jgi:asparagine synthase (glutamine-hydrolysing)